MNMDCRKHGNEGLCLYDGGKDQKQASFIKAHILT